VVQAKNADASAAPGFGMKFALYRNLARCYMFCSFGASVVIAKFMYSGYRYLLARLGHLAWDVFMSQTSFGRILMIINFEQVHNFYERVVFEAVANMAGTHPDFTPDMLADVACVALNRLPARYLRHDVDMMFYLTESERGAIEDALQEALNFAFGFVGERTAKPMGR
jgi:Late competence development protein ComFB